MSITQYSLGYTSIKYWFSSQLNQKIICHSNFHYPITYILSSLFFQISLITQI